MHVCMTISFSLSLYIYIYDVSHILYVYLHIRIVEKVTKIASLAAGMSKDRGHAERPDPRNHIL